jgi:peptidoglycan/LPS O-acetylase OafA/YrhL
MDFGAMLVALTIGIAGIYFGFEALNSPSGTKDGFPAPPYFIFGAVALLAGLLDIRMLLARGIQGAHRLARHLWRMCFALCIATASFFLGQAQVFPEPIRIIPLLAIPVVVVLLLMLYWLARVLFMQRYRRA